MSSEGHSGSCSCPACWPGLAAHICAESSHSQITTLTASLAKVTAERDAARAQVAGNAKRSDMATNAFARLSGDLYQLKVERDAAIVRAKAAEAESARLLAAGNVVQGKLTSLAETKLNEMIVRLSAETVVTQAAELKAVERVVEAARHMAGVDEVVESRVLDRLDRLRETLASFDAESK